MDNAMKKVFVISILIIGLLFYSDAFAGKKKILIIQSYHPLLTWTAQCEKGIKTVLGSEYEIHSYYMDTKRIPKSEFLKHADVAWGKYLKIKPDLVMIGDDNGLSLLGPRFSRTQTPVIYFGINNNPRNYFDRLPDNITGVLERTPIVPWLRYLKDIIPNAKKVLILMDSSPTSEAIIHVVFQQRKSVKVSGLTAEYRIVKDWSEWVFFVKNSNKYDILIMPTFHSIKDETQESVSVESVVEWTSANSAIPVFSNQDYTVSSKGVVGSYVIYGEAHGKLAGEMVLEILKMKKSPRDIRNITDRNGKFYFNKDQLNRFKLKLPAEIKEQAIFQ